MKKILKITLISIAFLVSIVLLAAAVLPKEYGLERSIVIEKPREQVFAFVRILRNQSKYDTWSQRDPKQKMSDRGTDGQVGAVYRWESEMEEVGVGEQEITKIIEGQRIEAELRFEKPFVATDQSYMQFEDSPSGGTKLIWGFSGKMPYPMNLMLLFMDMEKMLGDEFEQGLANLKKHVETNL